jgi:excisionase family DNA binding protein
MTTHGTPTAPVAATPALLTVNEAAAYLAVSRWTIYKLVRDGDVRALRVGERMRFRVADLDEYAARGAP